MTGTVSERRDVANIAVFELNNRVGERMLTGKTYTLIGADGNPYQSRTPGTLGGYKPTKLYGRLDCPSALRHLANGHYAPHRVFFADEATAIAAGYRPCARCMPEQYRAWKEHNS